MQLHLHAIIHICAMLGACASLHTSALLCIPRIGPARLRRSCRCPRRFRLRRILRRGQRPCRCLRRRHTLRSSSRPLRRHHMHLPHLLRSCTCPRGYPSRRKPVCVCVCVRQRETVRTREMITNDSIRDHEQARVSQTPFLSTSCLAVSQGSTHHMREI